MVVRSFELPCRRTRVTVSVVPVEGAQVMLYGVPAVIVDRLVIVNGFWAAARDARAARRRVVYCILSLLYILLKYKLYLLETQRPVLSRQKCLRRRAK